MNQGIGCLDMVWFYILPFRVVAIIFGLFFENDISRQSIFNLQCILYYPCADKPVCGLSVVQDLKLLISNDEDGK